MGKSGFSGIGGSNDTPEARGLSLALCLGLAGCALPARLPEAPQAPIGAHRLHTVLPGDWLADGCDAATAETAADQAAATGPWDDATIERIRRTLDYEPR